MNSKTKLVRRLLLAGWLAGPALIGAAATGAAAAEPPWIEVRGEVADAPFGVPVDAVFTAGEVWAVGTVERSGGDSFALAHWRRDPASGRLAFTHSFTREELGLGNLARVYSVAVSEDGRFVYLGARNVAFDSRVAVLGWDAAAGRLTNLQTLDGLPDSANEGELLLTPDGKSLYYGSRGIAICDRDPSTGLLTRRGIASSAAVIDLLFDAERSLLYSIGEEVLHVWHRDPATGGLVSIGIFDELELATPSGATVRASTGRRLLKSAEGRWLYALAFGPALNSDPWSLVVFDLQGVPLLAGWGQGGPTGDTFPTALQVDGQGGALAIAFSANPGGRPELAGYRPEAGGRRFGPAVDRLQLAPVAAELMIDGLRSAAPGELYAGGWDEAHWQRFLFDDGVFTAADTFDGVERLQQPADFVVTPDRETLLVAVPAAGALTRLGYHQGRLDYEGTRRFDASRLLLLAGGRYGVMLHRDGRALELFRLQNGEPIPLQQLPLAFASEIAASPDGRLVYAFGTEGEVFRFDAADERLAPYAEVQIGGAFPPRISPDGRFLLVNQKYSATFPFFLSDWLEYDPSRGTYRAFDDLSGIQDELVDLAFAPAGDFVYAFKGSVDPRLAVYRRDPATGHIGPLVQEDRAVPRSGGAFYFNGQLEIDADGRFLYNLREDDGSLVVYERDPREGTVRALEVLEAPDGRQSRPGGLDRGGRLRIAVGSTGNEVFLASGAHGKVSVLRHNCRRDDERSLCLGGRFRAEMELALAPGDRRVARRIAGPAADSGLFQFFSPANWESLVKVLDGCAQNGHFWVYAATASDAAATLRVTDTVTGYRAAWSQAAGPARPAIAEPRALPVCLAPAAAAAEEVAAATAAEGPPAVHELLLGNGRFAASVGWRTAAGLAGQGEVVPFRSDDSGLFTFFSPDNWELLIKVLDGCALNGHYWVYAAATTDLELRLEVKDLAGGKTRVYTNTLGEPARAITDALAFGCE